MTGDLSLGYLAERRRAPTLTKDEREAILLYSHGFGIPEIASTMQVSVKTVDKRLAAVRDKLAVTNSRHAACQALRAGLID
jgi:DNA-binding NarL/FixJ family response regulator